MATVQERGKDILSSLGLTGQLFSPKPGDPNLDQDLPPQFHWIHLADTNVKLDSLHRLFANPGHILPPRSGHIGNWSEICAGRSGPLDFNAAICRHRRFGYALLNDLTTTETLDDSSGDAVYLPGSMVARGSRVVLSLYGWNGREWTEHNRSESYYVPLVQTRGESSLAPLTEVHRRRDTQECSIPLAYYSDVLNANRHMVAELLTHAVESSSNDRTREQFLTSVMHNCTRRDGRVEPLKLRLLPTGGIEVNDHSYQSTESLIHAALDAALVASRYGELAQCVTQLPRVTPLLSGRLHTILYALLETHHAGVPALSDEQDNIIVHVHWAATQMAGFPPSIKGYFHSNVRQYRQLYATMVQGLRHPRPIFYVVAPASVFTLCPSSAFPTDIALTTELFLEVAAIPARQWPEASEMQSLVSRLAEKWWVKRGPSLSAYYKSNFAQKRSVAAGVIPPDRGQPIMVDAFFELTFMQASALVGALHRLVQFGP
jgi:hypothetical protein